MPEDVDVYYLKCAGRWPIGKTRGEGRSLIAWTFAPGDKVMQMENDYEKELYNGDVGTIDDVDTNSGELIASFDGRSVTYGFGELDTLVPAYAATIHKSQGSENPGITPCCSGTCSIRASRAARSWSYWSDRRRRSPSRYAMCRGANVGRSLVSGCGQNRLSHDSSTWRVESISQMEALQNTRSVPHSTAERLGFRPRGTPPQVSTSAVALRTASDGRHRQGRPGSRPGRPVRGKPQPKPYSAPLIVIGPRDTGASRQRTDGRAALRSVSRPSCYQTPAEISDRISASADRDTTEDTGGEIHCFDWIISVSPVPTRGEGKDY